MQLSKTVVQALFTLTLAITITFQTIAQTKPNIIFIMADDLGYETIGCNGNDDKLTPNLDALAASGMRFTNAHATPLCTPTRVQLMTGKYNHRNYIGFGLLDPKEKTFAHLLRDQGYTTCIAGKWQLLGNEKQVKLANGKTGSLPQTAGFDRFCLWQVDQLGSRYKNPTVYTDNRQSVVMNGKYGDDVFTTYIEQFLQDNSKKGPFMVYYPMCLTHDPFVPTPFSKEYAAFDPKAKDENPSHYTNMLKYMDYLVGRIVRKVDELGLLENTIIIFAGDNGTSPQIISNFQGGKRKGAKGQTIDRGTHVPLIASWANKIKPGVTNSSLVDFTDFFPTFLEIAGKSDNQAGLEGTSLYGQFIGKPGPKRDWIFCHYDPKWGKYTRKVFAQTTDWKVYENGNIFNLKADPDELNNLKESSLKPNDATTIGMLKKVIDEKERR
ncbi:sulfatase-like hydrolase/transferase [Niabella ginsengisoli]|uniref:Sulfatase-like hydrolase/transferase n=1 Tax=Niabella ginsengisoli TaxID=522298 RepID=A0ABS9SJ39_9BACT|nr:sulfatase-like hydrolase/transferase [Niabella ginsengisoli]MCH5598374.1 sulfatase-like hydrolase/transferase [Niabella ginsengisoli]